MLLIIWKIGYNLEFKIRGLFKKLGCFFRWNIIRILRLYFGRLWYSLGKNL